MYCGPIIDSHAHLWDLEEFTLPWLDFPGMEVLKRSFRLDDYMAACKGVGIWQSVYIEVDVEKSQQVKEAQFAIGLCKWEETPFQACVIGGDLTDREFGSYIQQFAKSPYVKGVRMVLAMPNRPRGLCREPIFIENLRLLGQLGLHFEFCVRSQELGDVAKTIEECPDTQFVLDHIGGIGAFETEDEALERLAELPNCTCKLSGIITSIKGRPNWTKKDLAPNILKAIELFGEDRVFFGSDWPPCTIADSLATWVSTLKEIVPPSLQEKIFFTNSRRVYRL
ncbi:MAG: hypothetical protein S4CHLAM102_08060 [Chlamydiia bacterium]|nr:hypothetical protein [Chlamydiia bacterium]